MTILAYLRRELNGLDDFIPEYRKLSNQEREQLQQDARVEMQVLGIELDERK